MSESIWTQDLETKVVRLDFKSVDASAISAGHERMMVFGSWTYTPLDNGHVHIVYESHADPGGNLPPLLVNPFCADVPVKTFQNLRKNIGKFKAANVAWIENNR